MRAYLNLTNEMFGPRSDGSAFFQTQSGLRLSSTTRINACLQRSYKASGAQDKFPQKSTITKTRKLLTSAARDQNSADAALVAAQLCHSVQQADNTYRLQARRMLSSEAVHKMGRAIEASHNRSWRVLLKRTSS